VKLSGGGGDTHEPLDLTTSRSTDSTMTADDDDDEHSQCRFQTTTVVGLPSPADDDASDTADTRPVNADQPPPVCRERESL